MRVLLRDAAAESKRIIEHYGDGIGTRIRQAQLDVARSQQLMWRRVGHQAQVAIGDGVDAAADSMAYLTEVYMNSVGLGASYLRQSILRQARSGIDSYISRGTNGIPLAQSVYKSSVESGQRLDRMINAMLLNGASAKEIARRAASFINPDTPGGVSYAAMRLGRTELNNAFHRTSKDLYQQSPFVVAVKWNLSGSHPKPDLCNEYAENSHMRNGEAGVFRDSEVPGKPHPHCLCYVTPVTEDDDEFVRKFQSGAYDDYIDGELGCSRG
jgi:hypothetical protein